MDTLVRSSSTISKSIEVDSVASFVDHVNNTVGKHFRCCICFSILEDPVMLPCNHSLCRGCAMQTMRQHRRCPLCLTNIPNLRTLQGRNKWITSMVDSLRNCLNEVGVNLTQHAPVPAKYLNNAHPPPPRGRSRARGRGHASADRRMHSPSPAVSCGGGMDGATRENGSNANLGRRPRGRTGAKRKRSTPVRPTGSEEETTRAPPSSRPRETVGERPVSNEPNTRSSQPRSANNVHVGEVVVQQAEGNLARAPSLSSNAPFPSSSSPPPFAVGDLISVDHRSWPGMNKQGGVGFINAVLDPPGSLYDIKYILTRKIERGIDARFVHPHAFLDGTLESRSRRGTGSRETRRARGRVGISLKKASGPDLTPEGSASQSEAVKSNVADNMGLRADPSRKSSPFCNAEEHRDASTAGEHTEGKRNATNEVETREEQVDGETREGSAKVQRNESDTALAVTNGVERSDSYDARLGQGSGQTKPTEYENKKRNGADESKKINSTFVAAGSGGRCDLSKARLGQGCHTVPGKENRSREEALIESSCADDDSDSDMTLIITGGEEGGDSSGGADISENEVLVDAFLDGEIAREGGNEKVIERQHLPVGVSSQSRDDRDTERNPGIDRVTVVKAQKSERPGHREAMVDRPQQAGQNSPRPPLTSDVQYDRRGRWTGVPLSKRGPSETEKNAGGAGIEKYIGSAQEVVDRLSPTVGSSVISSTRKFEGSPCHEEKAQNTSGDAYQLGLTSKLEKKRQESKTPSSVSSTHSMPDEPSERSTAACERPPPATFKSPSKSLETPSYKVGDLVEVLSRSSPGVNKEGGVARVTRVSTDGTYDVKYCVRHGAERAVKASIMSPYVMDEKVDTTSDKESNRVEEGQLPVPSPSTAGVSVRRTNRRGSCPPDAAVGLANAACLNLILGDTQHPELALDPDLLENLSPIEGGALVDPAQQKHNEVVPESGGSGCVTDSSSAVLGGETVAGKRGRPPRGVKKRKNDGSRHKVRKKKPKVDDRRREGSRALHVASRENGSVSASDSGAEGRPSKSRLGRATVVLTLSSLTPEMIAVAESLSCGHGWKIVPKYTADVTHVVCGTAPRTNKANIRSAKYLRAVASGKWVVNEGWLQECRLRGEHVKEEGYEISGDRKSTVPSAPRRSRLAHAEADRPGLFHGTKFHLRGHFGKDSPPKNELEAMLLANGGTVVESISDLLARGGGGSSIENRCGRRDGRSSSSSGTWRPTRVVIFQPPVDSQEGDIEALAKDLAVHSMVPSSSGSEKGGRGGGAKRHGGEVEVVKALWLVDSIGSYRVLQPTIVHRVQLPNCSGA